MNKHVEYLILALAQAKKRKGFCAPNPAVGAVLVKDAQVLSTGIHLQAGAPHAEVDALSKVGDEAIGATLYVTLEPCCHHGKTPPCVDLIIDRKVKSVYFSYLDPNPKVAGQGQETLRRAGILCELIAVADIDEFYQSYSYWTVRHKPWVTLKMAMSQDGKIAGCNNTRVQLTGAACQKLTHQLRMHSDAILTTVNTIRADDPKLNVRLKKEVYAKPIYILDSHLKVPLRAKIFTTAQSVTIFHAQTVSDFKYQELQALGVRCVKVGRISFGLDLNEVIITIGKDGVHDLWVEAGAQCFTQLLNRHSIQRLLLYVANKKLGSKAVDLVCSGYYGSGREVDISVTQCGLDYVFDFRFL